MAAARRELPVAARDWSPADVKGYLEGLDLVPVADALFVEEVNGALLLELSHSESGLLDAFAAATDPDRAAELAAGALTLGRQHALRRAVAALGGGPRAAPRRHSPIDDSDNGNGALQPAVS